jgi:VIT1/CCC1 family predicted Fe2+/Mn2+ transporter
LKIWKYLFVARTLGLTFGIKLMEQSEGKAQMDYREIARTVAGVENIIEDENEHETEFINLIDEERLRYVGSMVLGLNDALVELTGALAGLTLALQNTRLIATAGLVTGIAASLSMAASEYLATKSEGGDKSPVKASVYTGFAYILTVMFLIFPYLVFGNLYFCLGLAIFNSILVVIVFTFYVSVAQDISFRTRLTEMASISLGVATLSFGIGFVVRLFLNVDV